LDSTLVVGLLLSLSQVEELEKEEDEQARSMHARTHASRQIIHPSSTND
jgi:hypothetical protein